MTDKEIIKALECCESHTCFGCPFYADMGYKCKGADAQLIDLINSQQAEIERLENKLAMAKEDLKHTCTTCFYMETPSQEMPCRDCRSFNKWKWRGDEDDSE